MVPVKDVKVKTPDGDKPALEVLEYAERYQIYADDPEKAQYFVRVQWLDIVPESKAINEVQDASAEI